MLLVVDALCHCPGLTINPEPIELSHILYHAAFSLHAYIHIAARQTRLSVKALVLLYLLCFHGNLF